VVGSDDSDIVLSERVGVAGVAIARDDNGSSERGGCQESKNGDLHCFGRLNLCHEHRWPLYCNKNWHGT